MFDKIEVGNNKIIILRYTVEWQEQIPSKFVFNSETKTKAEIVGEISHRSIQVVETKWLEERFKSKNIEYTITKIDVPVEIEQYDGMEWNDGLDSAIRYINGDKTVLIPGLIRQLESMDYMTSKYADGEYTQVKWATIVAERKAIRQKIRELEALL